MQAYLISPYTGPTKDKHIFMNQIEAQRYAEEHGEAILYNMVFNSYMKVVVMVWPERED